MSVTANHDHQSAFATVDGAQMHYRHAGDGPPVVFIHGNPTSSYLWRNVMPHLTPHARTIAPDLIGMGRSDKPDLAYRFADHLRYLEGFMDALALSDVTLVLHDWGGGLGIAWARRNPDRVRAIAVMEAVLRPIEWSEATLVERLLFGAMRNWFIGDLLNRRGSFFLSRVLPMMTDRRLSEEELATYRRPYPTPDSRRPVAQWPREIPISGSPADVHTEIDANRRWFEQAAIPKLLLTVEPGMIIKPGEADRLARTVMGLEVHHLGAGRHYIQEDYPDAIGQHLSRWHRTVIDGQDS